MMFVSNEPGGAGVAAGAAAPAAVSIGISVTVDGSGVPRRSSTLWYRDRSGDASGAGAPPGGSALDAPAETTRPETTIAEATPATTTLPQRPPISRAYVARPRAGNAP